MGLALSLVGHDPVKAFFARSLDMGRLCSTYLFQGPGGIGKRIVARHCARLIFCKDRKGDQACEACSACSALAKGNHPGLQERDFVREKKSDQSTVDVVRAFIEEVYRLGASGNDMVYIIPNIQNYSLQVQNALLKTLEEPPAGVVFILTADQPERVLDTIASRSQILPLAPLSQQQLEKVLGQFQVSVPHQDLLLRMAQGRVELALKLAQDPYVKLVQWTEQQLLKCEKDFILTTEAFLLLASELDSDAKDLGERQRVALGMNLFERMYFQKCLERVRYHFVAMQVLNTTMEELIGIRRSVEGSGHVALGAEIYMQTAFSRLQQIQRFVRIPEIEVAS